MIEVASPDCPFCGRASKFKLDRSKYERWVGGELVQVVWPEMTPAKRERLISGIHESCWDRHVYEEMN